MKGITLFAAILGLAALSFDLPSVATTVDTTKSFIAWKGYKVTGQHNGKVMLKGGNLEFDNGVLKSGSFEIDMTTITCEDLPNGGERLVGHLKSEDFFGVEKFPVAKFATTKVFPVDTKGNYRITGNLTIKSTTKEIKFNAMVVEETGEKKATAKITIDRSDYDIRYGSGTFFENLGDKTIYDEFELEVTLVAK